LENNLFIMKKKKIILTINELNRITRSIEYAKTIDSPQYRFISKLKSLLRRAVIVLPTEIPNSIITLNTKVSLKILPTIDKIELTIMLPEDVGVKKNNVSILSPIGAALIGHEVGDIVACEFPSGFFQIMVDKIIYQPEASGHYYQ